MRQVLIVFDLTDNSAAVFVIDMPDAIIHVTRYSRFSPTCLGSMGQFSSHDILNASFVNSTGQYVVGWRTSRLFLLSRD